MNPATLAGLSTSSTQPPELEVVSSMSMERVLPCNSSEKLEHGGAKGSPHGIECCRSGGPPPSALVRFQKRSSVVGGSGDKGATMDSTHELEEDEKATGSREKGAVSTLESDQPRGIDDDSDGSAGHSLRSHGKLLNIATILLPRLTAFFSLNSHESRSRRSLSRVRSTGQLPLSRASSGQDQEAPRTLEFQDDAFHFCAGSDGFSDESDDESEWSSGSAPFAGCSTPVRRPVAGIFEMGNGSDDDDNVDFDSELPRLRLLTVARSHEEASPAPSMSCESCESLVSEDADDDPLLELRSSWTMFDEYASGSENDGYSTSSDDDDDDMQCPRLA